MHDQQKIKLAIALLVLSLVLVFVSFLDVQPSPLSLAALEKQDSAATPAKISAKNGAVIAGFPTALILDSNAKIIESYSLDYPNYTQYTTNFSTANSAAQEYQEYLKTFQQNYDLTYYRKLSSATPANPGVIYGQKGSASVAVQISVAQKNQSIVVLNYLVHK